MSYKQGDEIHIEDEEASAGQKTGHVRWILGISLFVAIALLSAIWIFGAFSQDEAESEISVSNDIANQETGDGTDGVILEGTDEAGSETEMQDGLEVIEN